MNKYYWSGISRDERMKAINEITDIINRYATILNFQKYSDISLNLALEVEKGKLKALHEDLQHVVTLEAPETPLQETEAECLVLLSITFTKGTGDLEIEVPDIPQ